MKRLNALMIILLVFLATISTGYGQKTGKKSNDKVDTRIDNMRYWMKMAEKGLIPYSPKIPYPPAIYKGTQLKANGVKTTNSPDVPVTNLTNATESENSVFVDPTNTALLLNSNNSTSWSGGSVGTLYGASYLLSNNGGLTWGGSVNGAGGSNSGDPATAIGLTGRQYIGFIDNNSGQSVAWSADNGNTWTSVVAGLQNGDLLDKNHMWIDNSPTSPYEGNIYSSWTDFGASGYPIEIVKSTDDGLSYSTPVGISSAINAGSHNQGVNIQTGPNGEVYVAWAVYDSWPSDETAIGFSKSTDGGTTYTTASRIISNIKGIRTSETSKNHRVNSFPVMAVDISGGPNNGNIYIVWSNYGYPGTNSGTNISVYMIRSTNGGTSWSAPIRVNQGPNVDGKEAYFPWISCDPETGVLSVVFYDDRNVTSTQCEVFTSYSTDAGNTWTDFQVSDVSFTPAAIPGLAGGYMGDYLGITSRAGKVFPCWTDNRGGLYMTYVSPFELGLNAGFTANSTTSCTGSGITFTSTSTGPPTSWTWSFPGGTPSSYVGQYPPVITYAAAGTYDVSLTVSDGVTTDTETKTGFITIKNLIADFTGTPTNVIIGNSVTFTNNSLCGATGWTWSFPGGTPSSFVGQTPPAITYSTLGTYDVSLTVTKPGFTDTKTRTGYITVSPPIFNMTNGTITTCSGDFYDSGGASGAYQNNENFTMTFYPSTPGAMIRFNFSAFTTESGYDYLRIYDGTSTSATLIGTYNGSTGPGIVTANNPSGALTFNFTSDGSVTPAGWAASISCYALTDPPVAAFTASATTTAINSTVFFTDQTVNAPTSWLWSFSPNTVVYVGGTSATSQNPQVQFTSIGQYTVSLTATNINGSDSEVKANYIDVILFDYCIPTYSYGTGAGDYITLVQLGSINNATGASASPYYTYYSALSTDLNPGTEYTITLSPGTYGSGNNISVWIDFNQNGVFDAAEKLGNIDVPPTPSTGTITFTVPADATTGTTRMRVREVWANSNFDPCLSYSYGETEDYNVNILGSDKTLNLTARLEGLYTGGGNMNEAGDENGPHFGAGVADQIVVELHNGSNYNIIEYTIPAVNLSTSGTASVTLPQTYNGSYYITIRHRNSIETTTSSLVSFAGPVIDYAFDLPARVFGGNLLLMVDGQYVIYTGDVNQDGTVDTGDGTPIDNDQFNFVSGYVVTDINGDGTVDTGDGTFVDNNQFGFVGSILP